MSYFSWMPFTRHRLGNASGKSRILLTQIGSDVVIEILGNTKGSVRPAADKVTILRGDMASAARSEIEGKELQEAIGSGHGKQGIRRL